MNCEFLKVNELFKISFHLVLNLKQKKIKSKPGRRRERKEIIKKYNLWKILNDADQEKRKREKGEVWKNLS